MRPSEIYYSQDSIKNTFDNGQSIYSTLRMCKEDPFEIDLIPRMRVCMKNGKWFTLDNRRLWVFRGLEESGHITLVDVIRVSSDRLTARKFTTTNDGVSVRIRQPRVDFDDQDGYDTMIDGSDDFLDFDDFWY
uniref:Uncharacterized protein n=1 Tax=Magallana gigas TaxID=29159 RepID=A0A8W8KB38_MAGGI